MIIKLEEKNKRKSTPWCHSPCTVRPPFAYNFYCKPHRLHVQSHRRWPVGSNKSYRRMHLVVRKLLPSPLPVGLFQHYALCSAPPNPTIQQNLWRSRIEKCTVNLLYIYIYIYIFLLQQHVCIETPGVAILETCIFLEKDWKTVLTKMCPTQKSQQ